MNFCQFLGLNIGQLRRPISRAIWGLERCSRGLRKCTRDADFKNTLLFDVWPQEACENWQNIWVTWPFCPDPTSNDLVSPSSLRSLGEIRNFQNFQFWIIHSYEYLGFRGQKYQEIGVAEPTWAHGKSLKPLHSEKRDAFWYRILSPCIVCWQPKWSVYILFAVLYIFLDSHSANLRIVTPWHLLLFPFYVIDGWNPAYRYYKPFV